MQRVEVTGAQPVSDRKDATAAKFILGRDDIVRFGDTNIGELLKRVPGITVSGGGSQLRDIRMRGLGGGYTQILINGEPAPPGFSLDSLSPDLIEQIEVLRSASADASTQSIAGSINIILRRVAAPYGQKNFSVGLSMYDELPSGTLTGQYADRKGNLSLSLAGNVNLDRDRWPSTREVTAQDSSGHLLMAQRTNTIEEGATVTFGLTPRLTWKPSDSQSLTWDALLQGSRLSYDAREARTMLQGTGSARPLDVIRIVNDSAQARTTANWKSPIGAAGRIDAKLTAALSRRESVAKVHGFDSDGREVLFRNVHSSLQDGSLIGSGKYTLGLGENHTLGIGWDSQYGGRSENRIQRETSAVGYPTLNLDEEYDAKVTRVAAFAQDEWAVTPKLSAYLGLRWEGLQTETSGNSLSPLKNQSSVVSPTMQVLWKVPDTKADQVRLSVARSYKAPTARELIPRRWVVNDNSPTSPNFQGNPNLVPELAWGVDVGYERYLDGDGFLGLNIYGRQIENVILQRVYEDGGAWVSTPINRGSARVIGIEVEAKGKLRQILSEAPNISFRSSLARNWSEVAAVPGPDNRLKDQPLFTGNVSADYQFPGKLLTMGGSFTYERLGVVRSSATQSVSSGDRKSLDVYGLWTIDKNTKLRVTLANLLKPNSVVQTVYVDDYFTQEQRVTSPSYLRIRMLFEMSL